MSIITPPFPLKFKVHADARGKLIVLDGWQDIPFAVKRIFWIYDVPDGARRGGHAHDRCQQVLIPMAGSLRVLAGGREFTLNHQAGGLYIPPGVQIDMDRFTPGTVLLVLCSHLFAEEDYIHDEVR